MIRRSVNAWELRCVGQTGCLEKLLEIAALRAARCVDEIEPPQGSKAKHVYAWLSIGGVHGDRFSAYYHGRSFSRAAALVDLDQRRKIAAADGASDELLAAIDRQRAQLWQDGR